MSSILHHAQEFFKGAMTIEQEIPIPLQIAFYAFLAVFITIVIVMFYPVLRVSSIRDSFMWYYYIAMFNLLNICLFLYFYYRKQSDGSLVGAPGNPGISGPKGSSGTNADCSLCATNLYIQPVKYTSPITHLDLDTLTAASLGPNLPDTVNNLAASTNHTLFDYNGIVEQLLINTTAGANNQLDDIKQIAENSEYVLLAHLNSTHGIYTPPPSTTNTTTNNNHSSNNAVTIHRASLATGAVGYISLGDSIGPNTSQTMFVINGDIRSADTAGYETRAIITTVNTLPIKDTLTGPERPHKSTVGQYRILKPRALKPHANSKNTHDTYEPMGEILVPLDDKPPTLHYALASTTCLEALQSDELQLTMIYPMQDGSGYISFWRTAFGTMHTRRTDILDLNIPTSSNNNNTDQDTDSEQRPRLYTLLAAGTTNNSKDAARRITQQLVNIQIPQFIAVSIILGHTIEYTKYRIGEILSRHWPLISSLSQPQNIAYLKQHRDRPRDIDTSDIPQLITLISTIATSTPPNSRKSPKSTKRTNPENKNRPKSLYDFRANGGVLEAHTGLAKESQARYELAQDYERMRVGVADAGIQIENVGSLLDLVLIVSGLGASGDLSNQIYLPDLSPTATRVLAICSALVSPPNERVFKPKDSCLVSSHLDSSRLLTIRELQKAMNEYNQALSDISKTSISKDVQGFINKETEKAFEELAGSLGSIANYMEKLQRGDFDEFSQHRLKTATRIFRELTNTISK